MGSAVVPRDARRAIGDAAGRATELVAAVALTVVATTVEVALVWRLLSDRPLGLVPRTLLCLLVVLGLLVGLAAWRPGRTAPASRRLQALGSAPSLAGVAGLAAVAVLAGVGHVVPLAAAVLVWSALGLASVAAARSWSALAERRSSGLEPLVPGGLLLVVLLLLLPVMGASGFGGLVGNLAALLGIVALVVVPAAALAEGLDGSSFREHAVRVEAVAARRPALGLLVLAAKVAVLLLVALAARWLRPDWRYLVSTGPIWAFAFLLALLLVSGLLVERRLGVTSDDHRALVGGPVKVLAAGLAAIAGLTLLVIVGFVAEHVPVAVGCLLVLMVGTTVVVRRTSRARHRLVYLAALVAGASAAFAGHARDLPPLPAQQRWLASMPLSGGAVLAGAAIAAVVLLVRVDRRRRRRLLLLAAVLLAWVAILVLARHRATGWSLLNLDLALWVVLLVAWVTWRVGLQRALDGGEVVLAAVATTVVLAPTGFATILLESMGFRLSSPLLALVLVAPGLVASVRVWVGRRTAAGPVARERVGRACTLYALILALAVFTGPQAADLIDSISEIFVSLLALPLAMLLVYAISASRSAPVATTV